MQDPQNNKEEQEIKKPDFDQTVLSLHASKNKEIEKSGLKRQDSSVERALRSKSLLQMNSQYGSLINQKLLSQVDSKNNPSPNPSDDNKQFFPDSQKPENKTNSQVKQSKFNGWNIFQRKSVLVQSNLQSQGLLQKQASASKITDTNSQTQNQSELLAIPQQLTGFSRGQSEQTKTSFFGIFSKKSSQNQISQNQKTDEENLLQLPKLHKS